MKKLFFIAISLILLVVGCAPKRMVKISGPMCPVCGKMNHVDTTLVDSLSIDSLCGSEFNLISDTLCFEEKSYGKLKKYNHDKFECSEIMWMENGVFYNYYISANGCCYEKYKIELIKRRVTADIEEGISDYNKGYFYDAEKTFDYIITYLSSRYKEYCNKDSNLYQLYQKAKKWSEKATQKRREEREKREKEFEKRLLEDRKNFGKRFKRTIINNSKDLFTEECLIPHCDEYKVWTSGPEYRYINVSSPYMDSWRTDYILGNLCVNEWRVLMDFYRFTRIYFINSQTGKRWICRF